MNKPTRCVNDGDQTLPNRQEILDDFLARLRRAREYPPERAAGGWSAEHAAPKVNGLPLSALHLKQHLDQLFVDAAAFNEAMQDVPDHRLTEDRMTNVVR